MEPCAHIVNMGLTSSSMSGNIPVVIPHQSGLLCSCRCRPQAQKPLKMFLIPSNSHKLPPVEKEATWMNHMEMASSSFKFAFVVIDRGCPRPSHSLTAPPQRDGDKMTGKSL